MANAGTHRLSLYSILLDSYSVHILWKWCPLPNKSKFVSESEFNARDSLQRLRSIVADHRSYTSSDVNRKHSLPVTYPAITLNRDRVAVSLLLPP